MPSADVVIVGSGLAGLSTAVRLAEDGARVAVVAAGGATLSWAGGPLDIAAAPPDGTPREGVANLAARPAHPYAVLAADIEAAVAWFGETMARGGLPYEGDLDRPLRPLPTALGATRPAAIVPAGMAAALEPWRPGEGLVVMGIQGDKDLWPAAVAAGLRQAFAAGSGPDPASITAVTVAIPDLADRRNRSALDLAHRFDEPRRRATLLAHMSRALDGGPSGPCRIALPAALGLEDHAAALAAARDALGGPVFELPMVPPSIPGLRLQAVLRRRLLALGGRILLGEAVARVELDAGRVARVILPAAARELTIRAPALVLATGGLTGGGLVALPSGGLRETVLGLPVEAPPEADWLAGRADAPGGHPIALAGIRTDAQLRPVAPAGVRIVGSLLAGQRYVDERCGDGVALASAWRAAASLQEEAGAPVGKRRVSPERAAA
jgi:glycerol-3-phosphate dehydrogenase subunit B